MANINILSQLQDLLKNANLNDLLKQAEVAMGKENQANNNAQAEDKKGGGVVGIVKVLKMLKSFQGGKILGNLGKLAGVSSLMGAATKLQESPENTEVQENKLNELDLMVAMVIEDGVISPEEEEMLSKKAEELGLNVPEFLAEVREKCALQA